MTPEKVLQIIRNLYKMTKEPLSLTFIHSMLKKEFKTDSTKIGRQLKYLHQTGKIELIGDRIKPKNP